MPGSNSRPNVSEGYEVTSEQPGRPALYYIIYILYGHTYSKSMDQPGKVANPARGQLNKEIGYFPVRVRA